VAPNPNPNPDPNPNPNPKPSPNPYPDPDQVARKATVEAIVPVVVELKRFLESNHSPLLRDLFLFLRELLRDHKQHLQARARARARVRVWVRVSGMVRANPNPNPDPKPSPKLTCRTSSRATSSSPPRSSTT